MYNQVVESRALEADMNDAGAVLVSTLTLVDLAGSERVAKTGNYQSAPRQDQYTCSHKTCPDRLSSLLQGARGSADALFDLLPLLLGFLPLPSFIHANTHTYTQGQRGSA